MTPLRKYALFQVPGWLLAAALLVWLWRHSRIDPWIPMVALAAWVAKDFLLYPILKTAYQSNVATGCERLVGKRGTARHRLAPSGYVVLGGELWQARTADEQQPIESGSEIVVEGVTGLVLTVRQVGAGA